MARQCSDCVYFDADNSNNFCRHGAPAATNQGSATVVWVKVAPTDWCAEGYNIADGSYDPRPKGS